MNTGYKMYAYDETCVFGLYQGNGFILRLVPYFKTKVVIYCENCDAFSVILLSKVE